MAYDTVCLLQPQLWHGFDDITKRIYFPPLLYDFPYMLEEIPMWMYISSLGSKLGHELGRAVWTAAKNWADRTTTEANRTSFFYSGWTVRHHTQG